MRMEPSMGVTTSMRCEHCSDCKALCCFEWGISPDTFVVKENLSITGTLYSDNYIPLRGYGCWYSCSHHRINLNEPLGGMSIKVFWGDDATNTTTFDHSLLGWEFSEHYNNTEWRLLPAIRD